MLTTKDGDILVTFLSKLANLSRSGVRFLERQGVLKPHYNESGYRVYPYDDFIRLREFQRYRSMGFSQKESLALGAMDSQDRSYALTKKLDDLRAEYERAVHEVQAALARTESASRLGEPTVVNRPAFIALPDIATYLEAGQADHIDDADRSFIEKQGIRWWNELADVSFGAVAHCEGGVFRLGRYALREVCSTAPGEVLRERGTVYFPPQRCLYLCGEQFVPAMEPVLPKAVSEVASSLGVKVCLDGTILRDVYIGFDADGVTIVPEIWYPVVEEDGYEKRADV